MSGDVTPENWRQPYRTLCELLEATASEHAETVYLCSEEGEMTYQQFFTVVRPAEIGAILFSGGTTGLPKRIRHSHKVLMAKVERMEWGWPTNENEVWLPVAPFTHVYGYLMGVTNPILKGGRVVIPPPFQPDVIVDLLERQRVTVFGGGPPAIYQALLSSEKFSKADLSALRVCPGEDLRGHWHDRDRTYRGQYVTQWLATRHHWKTMPSHYNRNCRS